MRLTPSIVLGLGAIDSLAAALGSAGADSDASTWKQVLAQPRAALMSRFSRPSLHHRRQAGCKKGSTSGSSTGYNSGNALVDYPTNSSAPAAPTADGSSPDPTPTVATPTARVTAAASASATGSAGSGGSATTGWSPPADLAVPLQEVWDHTLETYNSGDVFGFTNYGWDQIMATQGSINYCVRWDSTTSVTKAQRDQINAALGTQYAKWFEWLSGYDNFPYANISVQVTGWATSDVSLLEGDTSDIEVYTDVDADGIPECAPACGRFYHQDGDYSGCSAGEAKHYDQSLWLTDGFGGGAGGDWGQRIGTEYMMESLSSENIHILLHEQGHTFGLDDFYDWTPTGVTEFIMNAGAASQIMEFDGWMLRNWWYELSRDRAWQ